MAGPAPTAAPATTQPATTQPETAQPQALRPQDARPQRAVSRAAPTVAPRQGDLICGECGEGNAATRRFCSRCGASLATAQPVHIPWWRRLFRRRDGRAGSTRPATASRPGSAAKRPHRMPNIFGGVRRVVAVVLLLGGIGYAAYPPARELVNDKASGALHKVESVVRPEYTPVHAVEVRASAERPGHPAGAVADDFTNTYWAAPATGPEQTLTMRFDRPVELRRAIVRVGVSGNFTATNRPHLAYVVYSTGHTQNLDLEDKADAQTISLDSGGPVTGLVLHITSSYPAAGSQEVAITEIELFAKR